MLSIRQVFLFIDDHFQRGNQFHSGFRRVNDIVHMEVLRGAVRIGEFLTVLPDFFLQQFRLIVRLSPVLSGK